MNLITTVALLQFLFVARGSDVPGEQKHVGCYYLGLKSERYGTLHPEDIDVSICTHLVYLHGAIHNETQDIIFKPLTQHMKTGGESLVPRLVKLKAVNPDLKLILHISNGQDDMEPSTRSNIIRNGVKWLNESGFDGLQIAHHLGSKTKVYADFLCEMKNEFDKFGYSVTTSLVGPAHTEEDSVRKIGRCSEHNALVTHYIERATHRIAPMDMVQAEVNWLVEKGIPSKKILVTVPAFGSIFTLEDRNETGMGAPISGPGSDDRELMFGVGIPNKELLKKMNDSSLGWTIRRDNETKEPYAFSTTGLWASYEDIASIEYKANYVMEKGLGGMFIVSMEFDDDEGIGGEGRFPLTRTTFNALRLRNQTADG